MSDTYTTGAGLFTSGLAAHLTWTLPFGLLIMFAIFNRFDGRLEEAARDLGATPWQSFRHVVLPLILPALIGVALFGFTLSWDEIARSSPGHRLRQHPAAPAPGAHHHGDDADDLRARHHHDRASVSSSSRIALLGIALLRARARTGTGPTPARRETGAPHHAPPHVGLDQGAQLRRHGGPHAEPALEARHGLVQQHAEAADRAVSGGPARAPRRSGVSSGV